MKQNPSQKLSPAAAMIIFVCVMIIFVISLIYISKQAPEKKEEPKKVDEIKIDDQALKVEKIPEPSPTPEKTTYANPTYNFTLDFSKPYKSTSATINTGTRIDFSLADWTAALLIVKPTDAELIRSSYEIGQEDDVKINGLTATKIIGSSLKDGAITYIYLITHGDRLFALYSTSANIQAVANTLTFAK